MKQLMITAVILVGTAVAAFASNGKTSPILQSKSISLTQNFSKVLIGENLNVVFTNDETNTISLTGTERFIDDILISNQNGTLSITTTKHVSRPGIIYISIKSINSLILKDEASASSKGFLNCINLKVEMGSGSHANLKTKGKIEIIPLEGTQLDFEKFQSISEQ